MKENGFEYVDLGLPSKTMWGTCNVGATKPEDEGLLFQFGRVDGYRYGDNNNQFIKNSQRTASGKKYKKNNILDLEDDAAHVNMGGAWRMPTGRFNSSTGQYEGEWAELLNNTTQEVETINGVQGIMFTSNINGQQLFIPFMQGYWYNGDYYKAKSCACVWSSQVHTSCVNDAYALYCNSAGYAYVSEFFRLDAFFVRGVFRK